MNGEKLYPFIIFKRVPNGRVVRELRQADYNGTQVACTAQKNGTGVGRCGAAKCSLLAIITPRRWSH